jgi:uncharacterized membrane protein (UPF0127 family)
MRWVQARRRANGELLLARVRYCADFVCRLRGLTFRRRLEDDEGLLLINQRQSRLDAAIHMFFVFFPIAVVWLDSEGGVVDAQLARPFRPFYAPRAPAKDVLEGPPALLESLRVGDRLCFDEVSD